MFRVHQFDKVEMFVYCLPENSQDVHEELLAHEESIVQELGLPYRVQNAPSATSATRPRRSTTSRPGSRPGALPRDHLVLQHHRLPGTTPERPVPSRGRSADRERAHAQRDRRHRPRHARDHGELPGRERDGHGAGGPAVLRCPRDRRYPAA
ncbi:hypothetical protein L7F22_015021 [Adiantum nelumboides]|nr:hypothetical protein [Adiantum nelumboides]